MTNFNLIDAAWLPAVRRDGTIEAIPPWRMVADGGTAYLGLAARRADFTGALMQFLIGLMQTAYSPPDGDTWRERYDEPPTPDALQAALAPYRHAFELIGDGPCFMQDFDLPDGEEKPIAGLLIDAPGANTVRNNQDHFIKRGGVAALCPACAAAALHCLQTNAPSGGQGHRVGLRGGGPLTTLVVPSTETSLWKQVWLNVLAEPDFRAKEAPDAPHGTADVFPWLAPTRTSEGNRKLLPPQADLLQMFWAMPRRIRLRFGDGGRCDLCGTEADRLAGVYLTKNFGVSYEGWRHVLSPYSGKVGEPELPVHGQPDGAGFRHWVGWVVNEHTGKFSKTPARVVQRKHDDANRRDLKAHLWAFGYDMDNMKARAWVESRMPLIAGEAAFDDAFTAGARALVAAAMTVSGYLREAVKAALLGEPQIAADGKLKWEFPPKAKFDGSLAETLAGAYWRGAEDDFWQHLTRYADAPGKDEAAKNQIKEDWLGSLDKLAKDLFEQFAGRGDSDGERCKAIVMARAQLGWFNAGDALRKALELPVKEKTKGAKQ